MGGVSRSSLRHDPAGHAVFEGRSRWNGTVALPRCDPAPVHAASRRNVTCPIEVRGGGKQFKLSLLTDDGFDSLNYQCRFTPDGARLADDAASAHGIPRQLPRTRRAGRTGARPGTDPPGRADDRRATGRPFCSRHPAHRAWPEYEAMRRRRCACRENVLLPRPTTAAGERAPEGQQCGALQSPNPTNRATAVQRKAPVASARFLAAQLHESWSCTAAVRVGRQPTHSRHWHRLTAAHQR